MVIIRDSLNYIYTLLSAEGVFLVVFICILIGFIINLILSLSLNSYDYKKRRWFICLSLSALLLQITFELNAGGSGALIALTAAIAIPLIYFCLIIKGKTRLEKQKQIELARYIDRKVYGEQEAPQIFKSSQIYSPIEEEKKVCSVDSDKEEQEINNIRPSNVKDFLNSRRALEYNLDFTHVKNVLSRLDYYSLSPSDKRQVKELEVTLAQAETGEFLDEIKEKLNDGLGSLLKIMAKYGI